MYDSGGFHSEVYRSVNSLENEVSDLKRVVSETGKTIARMESEISELKRKNRNLRNKIANTFTNASLELRPIPPQPSTQISGPFTPAPVHHYHYENENAFVRTIRQGWKILVGTVKFGLILGIVIALAIALRPDI